MYLPFSPIKPWCLRPFLVDLPMHATKGIDVACREPNFIVKHRWCTTSCYFCVRQYKPRKHGCGVWASAPASDMAGHGAS